MITDVNSEKVSLKPTHFLEAIFYGDKKLNDKSNHRMPSVTIKQTKTRNDLSRHYSEYLKLILNYYEITVHVLDLFKFKALLFMIKQ